MTIVKFFLITKLDIKAIFVMEACKASAQLQESVRLLLAINT